MSELAMKVLQWLAKGNVGVSSATMASIALGMKKNFYGSYFSPPSDLSDLNRCMKLVQCIPEIKDSFSLIASECPRFAPVIHNWDELTRLLRKELKRPDKRAPETYARMKELLHE